MGGEKDFCKYQTSFFSGGYEVAIGKRLKGFTTHRANV